MIYYACANCSASPGSLAPLINLLRIFKEQKCMVFGDIDYCPNDKLNDIFAYLLLVESHSRCLQMVMPGDEHISCAHELSLWAGLTCSYHSLAFDRLQICF